MRRLGSAPPWLVLAGGDFVYKGVMAVYWVLLARAMSVDGLGVIALANAIALPAFVIIDAGLNAILVRDYEEVGGLPSSHRRTVRRRIALALALLSPLAGLGYILTGSVEAAAATGLMSAAYFCDFFGQFLLAPSRAATKMEPDAMVRLVQAAGTVSISLVFIDAGWLTPVWIALASTLAYMIAIAPAWRVWRGSRRWSQEVAEGHRNTADEGAVSQATVLMSAFGRADSILVQIVLGPAALAAYTVAYKLLEVARLLPGAVSRIILAHSSGAESDTYEPWRHLKVSLLLSLPGSIGIVALGPIAIGVLFGADYEESAALPAQILGLSIIPYALVVTGTMYAIGSGRGRQYRGIAVESLFVLLVTVVPLAELAGLKGAALGALISQTYSAMRFWSVIRLGSRVTVPLDVVDG